MQAEFQQMQNTMMGKIQASLQQIAGGSLVGLQPLLRQHQSAMQQELQIALDSAKKIREEAFPQFEARVADWVKQRMQEATLQQKKYVDDICVAIAKKMQQNDSENASQFAKCNELLTGILAEISEIKKKSESVPFGPDFEAKIHFLKDQVESLRNATGIELQQIPTREFLSGISEEGKKNFENAAKKNQ